MPLAKVNKIIAKLSSKESNTIQANTEEKAVQKSSVKNVTPFQEKKPSKTNKLFKTCHMMLHLQAVWVGFNMRLT